MRERENPEEEMEALGRELRRLPTPRPPEELVSRVRRLAHLEIAGQADERLSHLVVVFLLLFSWTVTLVTAFAVRLLGGANLLGSVTGSTFSWSAAYFVYAWISGAAILVLMGFHARRERRLA